ncbi:MAG: hypothetical protein LBR70_03325 [Lactobacillaceae bacterium]|jgi:hypothetical protein|nr:hypothetical protein [Lactobacillaceae bacterium]
MRKLLSLVLIALGIVYAADAFAVDGEENMVHIMPVGEPIIYLNTTPTEAETADDFQPIELITHEPNVDPYVEYERIKAQIDAAENLFDIMDKNADGVVTKKEFVAFHQKMMDLKDGIAEPDKAE